MTRRKCLFVLILGLFLAAEVSAAGPNWQLIFRYDQNSLVLLEADRIAPTRKQIRTPGLSSAPVRVTYRLDWRADDGTLLHSGPAELPLGKRVMMAPGEPCRMIVPDQGVVVVRVFGPSRKQAPRSIEMVKSVTHSRDADYLNLPPSFEADFWNMPVPRSAEKMAPEDGPLGGVKIRDTGPDDNRLVMVFMGDGYIAADLSAGQFESDVTGVESYWGYWPPWSTLFEATNLYRIDIESNERGADNEVYGVYVDTYLESSFWLNGIERLLGLTGEGDYRAYLAANELVGPGVWDIIIVLVNSTKYGGAGGSSMAISSMHPDAKYVVLHELGHSFANLADEYEDPYPGYPPGDPEPNVDFDWEGPELKWLPWVTPGTPLPTPEILEYYNAVGAFPGARYKERGIFRPMFNCRMRSHMDQFCHICVEAHIMEFFNETALLDDLTPSSGTSHLIEEPGLIFAATPLPVDGLAYEWSLDGTPIEGQAAPNLHLTREMMQIWPQTLELSVTLNSEQVRIDTIAQSFQWEVVRSTGTCCTGVVGDANNSGDYDATIGDITALIDHLFISQSELDCYHEADINQSGGATPTSADITIGDIALLIDHLFINEVPLGYCL